MNPEKWENATSTTILIVVGLCAGTVSFSHVIAWTTMYGQPFMVGVVNALVTELLQISAGLEIKRRRRTGRTGWRAFWFPSAVLLIACGMSLIGQLSQAGPGWQGRLVATLPMIGFLLTVKIVMGRSPATVSAAAAELVPAEALVPETQPRPIVVTESRNESPVPAVPVPAAAAEVSIPVKPRPSAEVTAPPLIDEPAVPVLPSAPAEASPSARPPVRPALAAVPSGRQATLDLGTDERPPAVRPSGRPAASGDFPPDLIQARDEVYAELTADGGRVTRDGLADGLRARGHAVSNGRASALLNAKRQELISA